MNLTSVNEVYAHIHREESRKGVMNPSSAIEKPAFISTSNRGERGGTSTRSRDRHFGTSDDRDHLKCEHCGRFRHTKD